MFGRLFGGKSPTLSIQSNWHPDLEQALAAFEAADWSNLSLIAARLPINSRFQLIMALGQVIPRDQDIGKLPETPSLLTVVGGALVGKAWRVRGMGTADQVDEDAWEPFTQVLHEAREKLEAALEIQGKNAIALAFLGRVWTGLSGEEEITAVQNRFMQCENKPLDGCGRFIDTKSAKWFGSHEDMAVLAETFTNDKSLPIGRLGFIAQAHIERWLYDSAMSDDPADNRAGKAYFTRGDIKDNIVAIDDAFWAEFDPHGPDALFSNAFAHNFIGAALFLLEDNRRAAKHIDALGAHPGQRPWGYFLGDEPNDDNWRKLRKAVGLKPKIKIEDAQ